MAEVSSLGLTTSVAVVSAGLGVFTCFMPELSDVLSDRQSNEMAGKVTFGASTAAVATVSIGAVLSYLTHTWSPIVSALGITVILYAAYRFAYQRGIFHDDTASR